MSVQIPDYDIIQTIIEQALREDVGDGDHTSLATVPAEAKGKAKLLIKDDGILAGMELAEIIFKKVDPTLEMVTYKKDGDVIKKGEIAFHVSGSSRSILTAERLVLNFMQRMSGIATLTKEYASLIEDLPTKLLDTRKTTPCVRMMEKWAVKIGGGHNHRYALYDMVMIKDNHVDYAGGITNAIDNVAAYLKANNKVLKVEIETRNMAEVAAVVKHGNVDRIMLDNFSPSEITEALKIIPRDKFEVEASGGINKSTLRSYALTGVDFISSGALTHSYQSLDLSLKADFKI
ncbi:carboxylating nicotinate-nucleotide diphosphorylase [Putridiphycobacter roseus]|uniref:Probable nicotinate-nucleotide pyrophosphorylase [carboxylating] n=1 Tax=Putridiphycobacter roseus TaxID=2219161 RepID=A0A2W1NJX9_9FLAO|nr:carboxylating nicotinate-nucleotide diphosphorylase [Putridiphycobacter roseus]PZE18266.1 carboxylating nicotinate-nucleotide diphosphorylase [Putridiphycobacter roseus]